MKLRLALAIRDGEVMEAYGSQNLQDAELLEEVTEQAAYMKDDVLSYRLIDVVIPAETNPHRWGPTFAVRKI